MTMNEMIANAALYRWVADQPISDEISERDRKVFLAAHQRGQEDAKIDRERLRDQVDRLMNGAGEGGRKCTCFNEPSDL